MGNKLSFNRLLDSSLQENLPTEALEAMNLALTFYSSYEIKNYIQAFGIDINNPPSNFSPLHKAVQTGRINIVQFMVEELNASPVVVFNGQTALELAFPLYPNKKGEEMVSILLQRLRILGPKNINVMKTLLKKFPDRVDAIKRWIRRTERFSLIVCFYEKKKVLRLPLSLVRDIVSYL